MSTLGDILDQIATELAVTATTTLEKAFAEHVDKISTYPYAEAYIGDLTATDFDLNTYRDDVGMLRVIIYGQSAESVRIAVEAVQALFTPLSTTLSALNVIWIIPTTTEPPQPVATSKDIYEALFEASIMIRYTY